MYNNWRSSSTLSSERFCFFETKREWMTPEVTIIIGRTNFNLIHSSFRLQTFTKNARKPRFVVYSFTGESLLRLCHRNAIQYCSKRQISYRKLLCLALAALESQKSAPSVNSYIFPSTSHLKAPPAVNSEGSFVAKTLFTASSNESLTATAGRQTETVTLEPPTSTVSLLRTTLHAGASR